MQFLLWFGGVEGGQNLCIELWTIKPYLFILFIYKLCHTSAGQDIAADVKKCLVIIMNAIDYYKLLLSLRLMQNKKY